MQTDTPPEVPASPVPVFDALKAEGGNPLGPHDDLPPPKFEIVLVPTRWPGLDEVVGPPPPPLADPEATLVIPPLDPNEASALAALDHGALPTPAPDPRRPKP